MKVTWLLFLRVAVVLSATSELNKAFDIVH